VRGEQAESLERELYRELPTQHLLKGRQAKARARFGTTDDVAFDVEELGICVVHLTWRTETDPNHPWTLRVVELPDMDA
jgi:hypothetical protein